MKNTQATMANLLRKEALERAKRPAKGYKRQTLRRAKQATTEALRAELGRA